MDDELTIEESRMAELQQARAASSSLDVSTPTGKVKLFLSFGKKISQHWLILVTAALFDLFALIPFISVVFNMLFGILLWLYFGPKRKAGSNEILKIVLPIGLGSVLDAFLSVIPVNIGAALIRIILD